VGSGPAPFPAYKPGQDAADGAAPFPAGGPGHDADRSGDGKRDGVPGARAEGLAGAGPERQSGEKPVSGNEPVATTGVVGDPEDDEGAERRVPRGNSVPRRSGPGDERESERGLRGLVGSGSSQVSVGAALRARDAARPSEAQLADADENLVIVRRNWTPREELPRR
jgi:hypothetical protein